MCICTYIYIHVYMCIYIHIICGKTMKIVSRKHKARHKHNLKLGNQSSERVEQFKYLATTSINQNPFQEEIKSRQRTGHACCHPLQNLLSSSLLSNDMNIYRTNFACRVEWV